MIPRPRAAALVGLLVALVVALPAAADWLVTRDGAQVETEGAWEVKGRQVVFTLKNGSLSALRLDDVDLEASRAATAASLAPPAEPVAAEPVEREPVLVLTNKDIPRAVPPVSAEAGEELAEGGGESAEETSAAAPAGSTNTEAIELVSWRTVSSNRSDGLELIGTLRNTGSEVAANVRVIVTVPDGDGGTLFETTAFLRSAGIAPGASTTFRAILTGIFQLFEDPVFDIRAGRVSFDRPPPAEDEADPDAAEALAAEDQEAGAS